MWMYGGSMDPDHVSPEELANDEVSSRLDRVLQLRPRETLDGKSGALNTAKQSNLVCSPLFISVFFSPFALSYPDFESSVL